MQPVNISYRIKLNENKIEVFDYKLQGTTFDIVGQKKIDNPPKWTELGFRQCANCPLNVQDHPHCPLALQLHTIVERFHQTRSIDEVELEVVTEERTVSQTTALQNAISSMLGLVFPISGCPKTAGMKPLARFHVPLASEEETVFNVAGMFLLAQYFVNLKHKNGVLSFDGLITMYEDLHVVNKTVASRLQSVTSSDSVKNAITLLDMYSSLIPMLLQDQLVEMRTFFSAYLPEGETVAPKSNYLEQAKAFRIMPTIEEEQQDALAKALATLRAEKEQELQEELKGMPDWLKQSMIQQEMAAFKPDAEKLKALQGTVKSESAVPAAPKMPEPDKKQYSDFVLNLQLEPITDNKPAEPEKPAPVKTRPVFEAKDIEPLEVQLKAAEAQKLKDKPASGDGKTEGNDGGLQLIDFEP